MVAAQRNIATAEPEPAAVQTRTIPPAVAECVAGKGAGADKPLWQVKYDGWLNDLEHPPGQNVLVLAEGSKAHLLDLNSGEDRFIWGGGKEVCMSPDGALLVSPEAAGGKVHLWNTASGELDKTLQHTCKGELCMATELALDRAGTRLAVGTLDGEIYLWAFPSGKLLNQLKGHTETTSSLAISPDGKQLASSAADGTLRLWDLAAARQEKVLKMGRWKAWELVYAPSGEFLAAGGSDGKVHRWRLPSAQPLPPLEAGQEQARSIAVTPDSELVAAAGAGDEVRLWQLKTGKLLHRFKHQFKSDRDMIASLVFIHGGAVLVSAGTDGSAQFWCVPGAGSTGG